MIDDSALMAVLQEPEDPATRRARKELQEIAAFHEARLKVRLARATWEYLLRKAHQAADS